jgi:hypothetical protein
MKTAWGTKNMSLHEEITTTKTRNKGLAPAEQKSTIEGIEIYVKEQMKTI